MRSPDEVAARFARLVEEVSGNAVGSAHLPGLAELGLSRARAQGLDDLASYVAALERGALADEWRQLLSLVTVKESYFFRTPEHFRALASMAVPELLHRRSSTRRLCVWSAGCARGEEPASIAITLAETAELAGWDWRVLATDVDEDALADARLGVYRERAVAQVPEHLRTRYLREQRDSFALDAAVLSRIDYRTLNLISEPFELPEPLYDIVFLRNVLIYFRPDSQRRVARSLARILAPDGFLFLGPSETLWQLTDELEPIDLGDCFCYRRPPGNASSRVSGPPKVTQEQSASPDGSPQPEAPLCRTGLPLDPPSFHGTGEEAIHAAVRALAAGKLDQARITVAAALLFAPTDASAHTLEGLLNDASADSPAALAAYRAALFLDPHLYQARLLLADCLRRHGADERARAEYRILLRTIDSGRARDLPFAAALSLPDAATGRALAAASLRSDHLLHGRISS